MCYDRQRSEYVRLAKRPLVRSCVHGSGGRRWSGRRRVHGRRRGGLLLRHGGLGHGRRVSILEGAEVFIDCCRNYESKIYLLRRLRGSSSVRHRVYGLLLLLLLRGHLLHGDSAPVRPHVLRRLRHAAVRRGRLLSVHLLLGHGSRGSRGRGHRLVWGRGRHRRVHGLLLLGSTWGDRGVGRGHVSLLRRGHSHVVWGTGHL